MAAEAEAFLTFSAWFHQYDDDIALSWHQTKLSYLNVSSRPANPVESQVMAVQDIFCLYIQ